jgi:hypothetical protein
LEFTKVPWSRFLRIRSVLHTLWQLKVVFVIVRKAMTKDEKLRLLTYGIGVFVIYVMGFVIGGITR